MGRDSVCAWLWPVDVSVAANASLHPLFDESNKSSRRLDVLLNTPIARLVQTDSDSEYPASQTVEMVSASLNTTIRITARKEIFRPVGGVGCVQSLR